MSFFVEVLCGVLVRCSIRCFRVVLLLGEKCGVDGGVILFSEVLLVIVIGVLMFSVLIIGRLKFFV